MPIVYLEPADLNAVQVQQMLDFLNRAQSAAQLDRDIEFPDEPDIGLKLGQRLLDARAALGGAFTAIAQVRAVRLVGPERFTEICVAALGLAPSRWIELFYAGNPSAPQAETGLAVTLDVRPQPAWLGLPLALTVRVADLGGTPRAGVAVTLHAGAGRLVWMYGFSRLEGAALTVETGADGAAELEWVRPPSEPLSEVQQAALEDALTSLDPAATDPLKLEAGFHTLAELYLLERSYSLRRAVDVHVRDHQVAMVDSLNPGVWRLMWPVESVLLQADVLAPAGGGSSVARAVTTVQWKNWVGAWLVFFEDHLKQAAGLDAGFAATVKRGGAEVVTDLLGLAQRFVAGQRGHTAQWLGQKVIDNAVARVVNDGSLGAVDLAVQGALLTQLGVAARDVSPTALGSYTLVDNARTELKLQIGAIDKLNVDRLTQFEALADVEGQRAATVQSLADQVQLDRQLIAQDRVAVQQNVLQAQQIRDQIGVSTTTFAADYARFNTDLAGFNTTRLTLLNTPGALQGNVGNLQGNVGVLQGNVGNLPGNVGNLQLGAQQLQQVAAIRSVPPAVKTTRPKLPSVARPAAPTAPAAAKSRARKKLAPGHGGGDSGNGAGA
jgi:hypothetical protein